MQATLLLEVNIKHPDLNDDEAIELLKRYIQFKNSCGQNLSGMEIKFGKVFVKSPKTEVLHEL